MARPNKTEILGPLERRVMDRLWRGGPASVGEILAGLNRGSPHQLAYTTVMTILVRLHEKGYLDRGKEGRRYRYAAAVAKASLPEAAARREFSRLIERHGASTLARYAADLTGADSELAERLLNLARDRSEVNE
jgi:predicted transcriptional regulator